MNHARVDGVADSLDPHYRRVALEPDPDRCCVVPAPSDYGPAEDGR